MFIRKRLTKRGTESYQMIETYRVGTNVRQKVLCNLGRSPEIQKSLEGLQKRLALELRLLERINTKRPHHGSYKHSITEIREIKRLKQEKAIARTHEEIKKISEVLNARQSVNL